MISFDESEEQICSRFVMAQTPYTDHESANIGTFESIEIADEVAPFIDEIRNKIDFALESGLVLDGKRIGQFAMVSKLQELLSDSKGAPRLVDERGKEFNPADSSTYTFNSALRVWRADR